MNESDKERQENELLALESIYGERQFVLHEEKNAGIFAAYVELPEHFKVAYPSKTGNKKGDEAAPSDEEPPFEEISISYLPPIILNFELPGNYPSEAPPSYTLTCKWLTVLQLSKLCKQLDSIWDDLGCDSEVLYEWMQFLTDDSMVYLDISSPLLITRISVNFLRQCSTEQGILVDRRTSQDASSIDNIVNYLTAYDSQESLRHFNSSYFNCSVCFSEKLGLNCVAFQPCKHLFCTDCMSNYFIVQINDGSVRSLYCPEEKCKSQADPSMVKKLVPSDVYEKYDKFLLQSTLDCMDDLTYCPRKTCQAPVLCESDSINLGRCNTCNFVFCVLCKRTYHGVANCAINSKEIVSLRNDYVNGSPEARAFLEKKYGFQRMKNIAEDYFSEAWIDKFSKKCPSCKSSIQKIDGCNKMVCTSCGTKFCWLCHTVVSSVDPYSHFNDLKSPCFNRLFIGVENDDDFEIEFNDEFDFL